MDNQNLTKEDLNTLIRIVAARIAYTKSDGFSVILERLLITLLAMRDQA